MVVIVASIPHTGTFFVADHLFGHLRRAPIGSEIDDTVQVVHFNEPAFETAGPLIDQFPTIVPMREKEAVRQSWMRRGMDCVELETLWNEVFPLRHPNMMLLQIDGPNRDEQLAAISERVGVSLSTTWPIVNSWVA